MLYSENIFQYLLRDTSDPDPLPWAQTSGSKRTRASRSSGDQHFINVAKYGRLFRHLEIVVEANRTGEEYKRCMEKALIALSPDEDERLQCAPPYHHSDHVAAI